MFGYLAKCFKTDLLDPLDKPPSLIKTINRILETIFTFFKETSEIVWGGCGISILEIIENCYPDRTNPGPEAIANIFIEPLLKFN